MKQKIIIGSRGSELALWQANFIKKELEKKNKNKFSFEDQEKLDIVTKRIINKILHHPTIELRKADDSSASVDSSTKIGIIRDLFGINSRKKSEKE